MLDYEELERVSEFASGRKVRLHKPVVLQDEKHREIVLADGTGLGARTVGVFIDDEMIVEGKNEFGALANLVDLAENLKIEVEEVEDNGLPPVH